MKKIIIMFSMIVSSIAFGQSTNPYVYDEPEMSEMDEGDNPAAPGDPVPIDQYIPVLLMVAAALAFAYTNKNKVAKNN
ncbi:hypothetical protein OF897_06270 [Chryseobacterium formosus]|uniref:Signal peptidase n=1 Tax=Chryseobacterium formosus TaxID=1537363 RepID=A0ABT3XN28_9FLAO|nr:hypothetical protein [Chryseobacterium formosus]MCX8523522.1 hypothetical protein [Chryseobacterium formosus]